VARRRRSIGVAVVGMGWMGAVHSRAYLRLKHHYPEIDVEPRLVVAVDPDQSRREQAEISFGFARTGSEWRDVIEASDVDVVSVTAPNFMHHEIGVAVAKAGKHLWIEKPAGRNLQETVDIFTACEQHAVISAVGFDYRIAPAVERAAQLAKDGAFGDPHLYRGSFLGDYAASPEVALSWRFRKERAGSGVLGDLMSHVADLALMMNGPIEKVSAQTAIFVTERPIPADEFQAHFSTIVSERKGPVENEDHVIAQVQFSSGAIGTLECGRCVPGRRVAMGFEYYGSRGGVEWNFERMNELRTFGDGLSDDNGFRDVLGSPNQGDFGRFQPGPGISMSYDDLKVIEASRFLTGVLTGQQQSPSMSDMVRAAAVIQAMVDSADTGTWTPVDRSVGSKSGRLT